MKKRVLLLFMMSVLLVMTGCGEVEVASNFEYNAATMVSMNQSIIDQYHDVSDMQYDFYMSDGTDLEKSAVSGFRMAETTDHVGKFIGNDTNTDNVKFVDGSDGQILCTTRCNYQNRNVDVTVYYKENKEYSVIKADYYQQLVQGMQQQGYTDINEYVKAMASAYGMQADSVDSFLDDIMMNNGQISPYTAVDCEVSAVYTKGELLKKAGINTAIGMITVFAVLIFIAFIIWLLKFIPVFLEGGKKEKKEKKEKDSGSDTASKNEDKTVTPIPPVFANAAVPEVGEEVKDEALIAVITAALYAYLGDGGKTAVPHFTDSKDKLFVRSIRRVR